MAMTRYLREQIFTLKNNVHFKINFGGDSFWRNSDNYVLMPEFSSHAVQPTTRIFVTCEDDTATDELDEMDSNMENLCKAVTEQALE